MGLMAHGKLRAFNMLTFMKQIFAFIKMAQISPVTDEEMRRNEENMRRK